MRCIFCKNKSDNSKSIEHVIPESLGSKNIVLPKGLVCDKCNNYFALRVEKPLLDHESIKNIRGWYQVPNKKGKMPTVSGVIAGDNIPILLKLGVDGKLDIQPERESHRNYLNEQFEKINNGEEFNPFIFKLDITPPQKEMSRFLAKMALEFLVFRFMKNSEMLDFIIDSNHFDLIRDFARNGGNHKSWPFSSRRIFPIETKMEHPKSGKMVLFGFGYDLLLNHRKEMYFIFLFYGVEFVINLGGPSIKGYEEWLKINKNISPIIERNGGRLVEEKQANKSSFIIRGDYNINNGKVFDSTLLDKF
jgi:HNH endonuclease